MTPSLPFARRWRFLALGTLAMLFTGVLYAWSILKIPFQTQFAWTDSELSLNFTFTMCFFCLGAFVGGQLSKKLGARIPLLIAAALVGIGLALTACLQSHLLIGLYCSYALLTGTGIGISYNVIVSTVTAWFPDRKGFCSGCLMMGFGISTLLLGNASNLLFDTPSVGWRKTYLLLSALLFGVLLLTAMLLRRPPADLIFPAMHRQTSAAKESIAPREFTTREMLRSFTFWRAFFCLIFLAAVGTSVISFARELSISVGAAPLLATTLVGILSLGNGVGRILIGAVYDGFGRRIALLSANLLTIVAAGIMLWAIFDHSLPLCIVGLCLIGLSYGSTPTLSSALVASLYGQKHFAVNYSVMNFSILLTSSISAFSSTLYTATGSYIAPFALLLGLSICALGLTVSIRKP